MSKSASELAESKLIILYLIYKMDLPMSTAQILEFVVLSDYMDYFSLQQYLIEMVEGKLLKKSKENNNTNYTLTENGEQALIYFTKHIPNSVRDTVNNYVAKNKKKVKHEVEVVSNYFYNSEKDYIVKCGVYEDDITLMEINVSVVSKEHARLICNNWKSNVNTLYGSILKLLAETNNNEKTDK